MGREGGYDQGAELISRTEKKPHRGDAAFFVLDQPLGTGEPLSACPAHPNRSAEIMSDHDRKLSDKFMAVLT
jgi:hypothetical protein